MTKLLASALGKNGPALLCRIDPPDREGSRTQLNKDGDNRSPCEPYRRGLAVFVDVGSDPIRG